MSLPCQRDPSRLKPRLFPASPRTGRVGVTADRADGQARCTIASVQARPTYTPMPYHRFKVGQIVVAPSSGPDALIPRGPHVIVRLLPWSVGNHNTGSEATPMAWSGWCWKAKSGGSKGCHRRRRIDTAVGSFSRVRSGRLSLSHKAALTHWRRQNPRAGGLLRLHRDWDYRVPSQLRLGFGGF